MNASPQPSHWKKPVDLPEESKRYLETFALKVAELKSVWLKSGVEPLIAQAPPPSAVMMPWVPHVPSTAQTPPVRPFETLFALYQLIASAKVAGAEAPYSEVLVTNAVVSRSVGTP